MSDTASSWAGWAVSAVTSKFYKSQSSKADDTSTPGHVKNTPPSGVHMQSLGDMNEASVEERSRKSSLTSESSRNENPTVFQLSRLAPSKAKLFASRSIKMTAGMLKKSGRTWMQLRRR